MNTFEPGDDGEEGFLESLLGRQCMLQGLPGTLGLLTLILDGFEGFEFLIDLLDEGIVANLRVADRAGVGGSPLEKFLCLLESFE
ncbi:hypothetical protein [Thiocystis violacea]|uniref:hypothetical protein n=1 Tax=Thiocystis violacea TaxID=13725 RepID=UPI001902F63C|nr:hypothetical protein [Thiocystis violacea]